MLAWLPLTLWSAAPCQVLVVDEENGWPVPLVELRTTHHVRLVSDNAGVIALDLPECFQRETWFSVEGHGYGVPADGFGYRGVRLTAEPGATRVVKVKREIIAKRIGRLTGTGLLAEWHKCHPDAQPASDFGVWGCDSVQTAQHRDRLYWFWGDTTVAGYPLGIFHASGAVSGIYPLSALEPPLKMNWKIFQNEGRPKPMAVMPGKGPTWLTGVVSLPDRHGTPHLVATFMKVEPPLEAYQWGLAVWDESQEQFVLHKVLWTKSEQHPQPPPVPEGHAVFHTTADGASWVVFGNPFPTLRCRATFEDWSDPSCWEVLPPPRRLRTVEGTWIEPHSGSLMWNEFRQRWLVIVMEKFGKPSTFGEVWYLEGLSPTGPWGPAIKVLSHNNYTFYNPRWQPGLSPLSRYVFFEGTYSALFARHPEPTPRYDYNQVLYRLDLDDARLQPAQGEISAQQEESEGLGM